MVPIFGPPCIQYVYIKQVYLYCQAIWWPLATWQPVFFLEILVFICCIGCSLSDEYLRFWLADRLLFSDTSSHSKAPPYPLKQPQACYRIMLRGLPSFLQQPSQTISIFLLSQSYHTWLWASSVLLRYVVGLQYFCLRKINRWWWWRMHVFHFVEFQRHDYVSLRGWTSSCEPHFSTFLCALLLTYRPNVSSLSGISCLFFPLMLSSSRPRHPIRFFLNSDGLKKFAADIWIREIIQHGV